MKKFFSSSLLILIALFFVRAAWAQPYFGQQFCSQPGYICIKTKKGDTWDKLFPYPQEQELVRRINRTNMELNGGTVLAVPTALKHLDIMHFSPFAVRIDPPGKTLVIVDLSDNAFAAYNPSGTLIHWGPVSAGKDWCPDVGRGCRTPKGVYQLQSKGSPFCISSKYPVPDGGAKMPYCMFFYGGYALHASNLPGYHDSHGCVRLFYDDAKWLNLEFAKLGSERTMVIVRE
jgi:L,D-transpeptidase ErfK/SrfK